MRLHSERLALSGVIDMVIETEEAAFPVDFKLTRGGVRDNHVAQIAGYALLLAESSASKVETGFIYLIPAEDAVVVPLDKELKARTLGRLDEMRVMIERQSMPDPTEIRARCTDCEYRNWCGDVM
ncbi:MAG: CRISPR-associated protein Cas4 [Deltaproteobacteria bacterium]|nr:CRISPR-associated protein Cas4 [Deltaproteobacteria bacterium]